MAGDLIWYPVEGHPEICQAPDALVAFGRPRDIAVRTSNGRRAASRRRPFRDPLARITLPRCKSKFGFYERYGVEEYYIYDPDEVELFGRRRANRGLEAIAEMDGWISPLLGIRFDMSGPELVIYGPDGRRFLTYQSSRSGTTSSRGGRPARAAERPAPTRARCRPAKDGADDRPDRRDGDRAAGVTRGPSPIIAPDHAHDTSSCAVFGHVVAPGGGEKVRSAGSPAARQLAVGRQAPPETARAPLEDAERIGDGQAVVRHRYAGRVTAGDARDHFTAVLHAGAAVDHEPVIGSGRRGGRGRQGLRTRGARRRIA